VVVFSVDDTPIKTAVAPGSSVLDTESSVVPVVQPQGGAEINPN
jgi:hypothetical protein